MRPDELRPPFFGSGRTSDFSGSERVTSTKSATLEPRRPGVVGLYLRIPIGKSVLSEFCRSGDRTAEDVDPVAGGDADNGSFDALALTPSLARAASLARPVEGVDAGDGDVEHLLDRDLDLGLVGVGVHL